MPRMALRGLAGDMARNTAGLWKVVADVVDPKPPMPQAPRTPDPAPAAEHAAEPDRATIDLEAGQMLVPIDAWTRILEQVGHVHEAGQQVAEARERAARAETENEFLKEQLRELKAQVRPPRRPASPPRETVAPAPNVAATEVKRSRRERIRLARETASRWIDPGR